MRTFVSEVFVSRFPRLIDKRRREPETSGLQGVVGVHLCDGKRNSKRSRDESMIGFLTVSWEGGNR